MPIQAPGIGSNLDVNGIVSQLMAVERQPLTLLKNRTQAFQTKLSGYGTLKGGLSNFQTALKDLSNGSKFTAAKGALAEATIAAVSVDGAKAVPGTYTLEVERLAQQHKVYSAAAFDATSAIGSGSIAIQFGSYDATGNTFTVNASKAAQTIAIGAGQGSLGGIRDSINAANIGVSATIVTDNAGARLVITSKDSGAANSLRLTVTDDDGNATDASGLSQLAYDPTAAVGAGKNLTQSAAAQDARLAIDGIWLTKSSNNFSDVVDGVTLNLQKTNLGTPTTLTIERDKAKVQESIEAFIKSYNDVSKTLRDLTAYNEATRTGAALQGDATVRNLQAKLRGILAKPLSGTAGAVNSLSQIGVSVQRDGSLALNAQKLDAALQNNFASIPGIFAAVGSATDSLVSVSGSTAKTQAGSYALNVTQLATQGTLGGSAPAALTIAAGVNDALSLSVDGVAASVTLSAGTYANAAALAAEVQSKLNGALSGVSASVSEAGGVLTIKSNRYGSASAVSVTGGNGATDLLGGAPVAAAGINTLGSINGAAATGNGQILTGASGNAAEGLGVRILGGALGARGTLGFAQGYAYQLNVAVEQFLDDEGPLQTRTDGLNASIRDIQRRSEAFDRRLEQVEKRYRAQFTALDTMMSNLQSTSSFLTQQLANLPSTSSNR
jgi:flagellar hook-associated protein 2